MSDTWRSPGTIVAVVGTIITAVGIYIAYYQGEKDKEEERLRVEDVQHAEERKIQDAARIRQEKIDNLTTQIAAIEAEIEECRGNIGRATLRVSALLSREVKDDKTIADMEETKNYAELNTKKWKELEERKEKLEEERRAL